MKIIFFIPAALLSFLACSNTSNNERNDTTYDPPDLSVTEIQINTTERRQPMDGVGADCWTFPFANDVGWNWDQVKFVFDELNIKYIRIAPWFNFWEEYNDNSDPDSTDWTAFDKSGITTTHDLGLARYAISRGIEVDLGIWGVSDWLLKTKDPASIDPALYPELGESIASYIKFMKDHGVDIKVAEIQNEPNIAAGNQYAGPEDLESATLQILRQLNRFGLKSVMLHTPNLATPDDTRAWGTVLLSNDTILARTAAISYHTWWVDNFSSYDDIRQFAAGKNKPVWATEIGYCALAEGCFGGTHFLKPETWGTAWDYALSFYRAIEWSRASRLYHWSLLGHDGVVSPSGSRLVSFWVLKHFANFIPAGSYYLQGDSGDANLLCMPFEFPDGTWSAILINTSSNDKFIQLSGAVPFTITEAEQTTRTAYYRIQSPIKNKKGEEGYLIPGESLTSFKMK